MGEVIGANASGDAIEADIINSHQAAAIRGDEWKIPAQNILGPVISILGVIDGKLGPVQVTLNLLESEILLIDEESDQLVGAERDSLWNALGRKADDVYFEILFPGGKNFYTRAKEDEQVSLMYLLAEMLESNLHPKLDSALSAASAGRIRAQADIYKAKVDAIRPVRAKAELLATVRKNVVRAGRSRLVALKRAYLAAGFSETEIHQVIPDRPTAKKAAASPEPGKQNTPG